MVCGATNVEVHHLGHGNRGRRDDKCIADKLFQQYKKEEIF
jgi:hypothetical protein